MKDCYLSSFYKDKAYKESILYYSAMCSVVSLLPHSLFSLRSICSVLFQLFQLLGNSSNDYIDVGWKARQYIVEEAVERLVNTGLGSFKGGKSKKNTLFWMKRNVGYHQSAFSEELHI